MAFFFLSVEDMSEWIPKEDYITKAIRMRDLKVMGRLFFLFLYV